MLKQKYALHKLVRLRQRYILTRSNKIRVRYIAGMAVLCLTGFISISTIVVSPRDFKMQTAQSGSAEYAALASNQKASAFSSEGILQSGISEGIRKASAAIKKSPPPLHKFLTIDTGDTIAGLLEKAGLNEADAYHAVEALSAHYDPRKLKPGQEIKVNFKPGAGENLQFSDMTMDLDPLKQITITKKQEADFAANLKEKELEGRVYARRARIETSLYGSALRAGIPADVVAEIIKVYSWNIDFQRDIRRGDKIEVFYEGQETEDGDYAKTGNILYANLSVGGKEIPIYRYETADGYVDYFTPEGHSVRKMLLKTPIDGARISSGFGMRKHPILGYTKMHKGIDFAAVTGTPIYAAGDGTVDFMGQKNGYGNYIRIRHNASMKTAYAHMQRFAKGVSNGKRVRQGDIVGYVGATGRATGPHLHYEILVNNVQVNPKSVNLPTGQQLAGKDMKNFKARVAGIHQQYVSLSANLKFAQKDTEPSENIQ